MKFFVFLVLLLSSFNLFSKGGSTTVIGNGGVGVEYKDRVYLLDLVSEGVALNPFFKNKKHYSQNVADRIEVAIEMPGLDYILVAAKLREIERINPFASYLILLGIENFMWRLSGFEDTPISKNINDSKNDPVDLKSTKDFKEYTIEIANGKKVNLAVRKNNSIDISRKQWARMNRENRVALIFHEILYAWIEPSYENEHDIYVQSSYQASIITGFLFSEKFSKISKSKFNSILRRNDLNNLALTYKYVFVDEEGKEFFTNKIFENNYQYSVLDMAAYYKNAIMYYSYSYEDGNKKLSFSSIRDLKEFLGNTFIYLPGIQVNDFSEDNELSYVDLKTYNSDSKNMLKILSISSKNVSNRYSLHNIYNDFNRYFNRNNDKYYLKNDFIGIQPIKRTERDDSFSCNSSNEAYRSYNGSFITFNENCYLEITKDEQNYFVEDKDELESYLMSKLFMKRRTNFLNNIFDIHSKEIQDIYSNLNKNLYSISDYFK